jgi:hypothetical protein
MSCQSEVTHQNPVPSHLPVSGRTRALESTNRQQIRQTSLRFQVVALAWRVYTIAHIWCASIRSCFGHIRSQSSKAISFEMIGSTTVWDQESRTYRSNPSAIARILYTKMLSATFWDWADTIDLRMFLMGFDAGEQWTRCTQGIADSAAPRDTPSWLLLAQQKFGYVPELVAQEINAFRGQTSDAIPAAIAGVTRKDECTRTKL